MNYLINESDPGKKINKLLIELRDKENKELQKIREKLKEKSIDIVIKKENLITGKKDLDITKFILDELNKKKIKF